MTVMESDGALAIICGTIFTPFETIDQGLIIVENGKIASVCRESEVSIPNGARVIDAIGKIVTPGFIDTHIHGGKGSDIMDASYEAINKLSKFVASHGTTSFLPTTISASHNDLLKAVRAVREAMKRETDGAEVLGVHLEGPYISLEKLGAQDANYIRPPSLDEFREIWEVSDQTVRIITLAPEIPGSKELIMELRNLGVVASVGHSNATYSEVVDAIMHGLRHATHMFNGMREFHHREPGVVGAVLLCRELTAELISDNVHVHPASMKLLTKIKGSSSVVLVTDAIRAAGAHDGKYKLGKQDVIVKNGVCRLESGELAGSTLTMDKAVRNMIKYVGLPLRTAIRMATINPAKVIGVNERKGSLELGKDADIVIIDENANVYMTIRKGKIVYKSG